MFKVNIVFIVTRYERYQVFKNSYSHNYSTSLKYNNNNMRSTNCCVYYTAGQFNFSSNGHSQTVSWALRKMVIQSSQDQEKHKSLELTKSVIS